MLRILGTETEFGIIARSPSHPDPVANSLRLISHCPRLPAPIRDMAENVRKKVFWILGLLTLAVLSMVLPKRPFNLGLDLQGGTRLVYSIDFEAALEAGQITSQEFSDKRQLLQDTLDIKIGRAHV